MSRKWSPNMLGLLSLWLQKKKTKNTGCGTTHAPKETNLWPTAITFTGTIDSFFLSVFLIEF
jgi:hypothetical protein